MARPRPRVAAVIYSPALMTDILRIGVDIGGTFTDVCLVDAGGRTLATAKLRTTPSDPSLAVVEGARMVARGRVSDATAVAEAVGRAAPAIPLSLSSRISGQMREYERMVTTVANAYVQPIAARYMERLAAGLGRVVPGAALSIMTSNGGVTGVAAAVEAP